MVDAAGATKYTYYPGGLLNTEDGPFVSDTVTYTYNNARLRSGLALQQPTKRCRSMVLTYFPARKWVLTIDTGALGLPGVAVDRMVRSGSRTGRRDEQ
jgi:hypothetical protein